MDAALLDLLTDTVTLAPYVSQDAYGTPTYGATQTLAARVQYKVQRITNAQGQERVSQAKVFLDGTVTVALQDKLTLPDGRSPAIQLLYEVKDVDGSRHHIEVWL